MLLYVVAIVVELLLQAGLRLRSVWYAPASPDTLRQDGILMFRTFGSIAQIVLSVKV